MSGWRKRAVGAAAAVLVAVGTALAAALPADAHSALVGSDPADGATVERLGTVTLTFSEELVDFESATAVLVTGPDGADVALPEEWQLAGNQLSQPIGATAPGEYTIAWRVVSADGHPISGSLRVTVAGTSAEPEQPAASAEPTTTQPAASTSASATSSSAPTSSATAGTGQPSQAPGDSLTLAAVAAIAAGAVLAVAIAVLRRRHRPPASNS